MNSRVGSGSCCEPCSIRDGHFNYLNRNFSETDDNDNFEGRMLELTKTVSANSKSLKVVGLLIIL